ncbi:MAG: SIR2 family protein [Sphaerochaeta sp.]|nr:SIR2 family protein [Sphaerochaeta sp.]
MNQNCSNVYSSQNPVFNADLIFKLKNAAKSNLVIFLGAGISMDVNLPSWIQLLHGIAQYCSIELDEELKSLLDTYQYDAFLDMIMSRRSMSERDLNDIVASVFRDQLRKISSDSDCIYSHLASFQSERIITTNYDNLCARFMDLPVFSPSGFLDKHSANELLDSSWCLALHGMYNKPETIVLSKDSYESLYREEHFKQLFSHMSKSVRLLFLGFSFKDNYYVKTLVESLGLLTAKHYALVEYHDQNEKERLEESLPFFTFQFFKSEPETTEYTRRETIKRFVSEIYSEIGPLVEPELEKEFEEACELFIGTPTVEKGISKLHELEIRTNGRQLPQKYSGYLLNANLSEAFINNDLEAIARFERCIENSTSTSNRYRLMLSLGLHYLNSRRYEKALEVLKECKLERPEAISPNLYYWCAKFKLGLLGDYWDAISEYIDELGNIKTDMLDDEKSRVYQIIGEMGLTEEVTLVDAEKFLDLANRLSPDVELLEDFGYCHLQKEKYFIEKNHYPTNKELTIARKYFEDAMASSVESINRCYRRIAVYYLEVLDFLNLPMEYVNWFDKLKDYIYEPKDQLNRLLALAKFEFILGIGISSRIKMFDEDTRKRFIEEKTYSKGDYDSYLCLMGDRIDGIYKTDTGKQREYLFALFNAKRYVEFKNRIDLCQSILTPVEQDLFSALLLEIEDFTLAEEAFITLTRNYDEIFIWNELLAFYRRHHDVDALIATLVEIQVNHFQLIEPNPSSFYVSFFYTMLDDTSNPDDAYRIIKGLNSTIPEDILSILEMDLSQRIFCLNDTYVLAMKIKETFAWKMNIDREKVAIIEYLILSLRFDDVERQIVEYQAEEDIRAIESSLIFQVYRHQLKNQKIEVDYSMINIEKFEADVSRAMIFMNRFPELTYIKDMKICLDVQTLAVLISKGKIEYLLSAEEILINYASMYQLFLLMGNVDGELLDNNLFTEIINWIIQHKDKVIIGGCSVDDYFNVALNPQNQKIFSLLQIDPYPEKIHILNQLPHNRTILMTDKRVNQTKHPICIRLGENREIQILGDSKFREYDSLVAE